MKTLKKQLDDLGKLLIHVQSKNLSDTSSKIPIPGKFSFVNTDWPAWKRYRLAVQMNKNDEKTPINNLLLFMSSSINNLLDIFQKKEEDWVSYKELIEAFDNYYIKKRKLIYERAKFNQRQQLELETTPEYIESVIKLAKTCKYGSLEVELIRDRLVVGVRDKNVCESLHMDENLTLGRAKNKIVQYEGVKKAE